MINLSDVEQVKGLQSNIRTTFESKPGKEVIKFLESECGWYDFHESDPDRIMVAHGKRQVLAMIKTLLTITAEQVVLLAQQKEIYDAG